MNVVAHGPMLSRHRSEAQLESSGEIDRLRDELIVLRAENVLLRQSVEQLKARLNGLRVRVHTAAQQDGERCEWCVYEPNNGPLIEICEECSSKAAQQEGNS